MPQNEIRDMGRDLALADPFMQIGTTIAKVGELAQSGELPKPVLDAYDYIKSHVASGGKAIEDAANTLKTYLTTSAPAPVKKTQVGPYQVEHVAVAKPADAPKSAPAAKAPDFTDDELLQLYKDPKADLSLLTPEEQQRIDNLTNPGANWRQATGKGQVIFSNKVLSGATESLPAIGGTVGQIVGGSPGAALGGAAGEGYRQVVRAATGNPVTTSTADAIGRMGVAGAAAGVMGAIPEAIGAIPTTAKAGPLFQQVMSKAKDVPVDVNPAGEHALRIAQLAERGGRLPKPVSDFLRYATNPDKPPMTFEVARDFAKSLGRLSVNERNAMIPEVQREVAIMAGKLSKSVADAAGKAGVGQAHAEAMTQYARAKGVEKMLDEFLAGARKSLPWMLQGSAAAAGFYGTKKAVDLASGGGE
jgi:hypothetical protein